MHDIEINKSDLENEYSRKIPAIMSEVHYVFDLRYQEGNQKLVKLIRKHKIPLSTSCSFRHYSDGYLVYYFQVNGKIYEICDYYPNPLDGCYFKATEPMSRFIDTSYL